MTISYANLNSSSVPSSIIRGTVHVGILDALDSPMFISHLYNLEEDSGTRFDTSLFDPTVDLDNVTNDSSIAATGKIGNALNADATFGYVDNDTVVPGYNSDNDISISCWVNFNNAPGSEEYLIALGPVGRFLGYVKRNTDGTIECRLRDQSLTDFTIISDTVTSASTWYHIVAVWMQNDVMRLYINGVEDAVAVSTSGSNVLRSQSGGGAQLIRLGADNTGVNQMDGILDQVAFYTTDLVPSVVTGLYNNDNGVDLSVERPIPFSGNITGATKSLPMAPITKIAVQHPMVSTSSVINVSFESRGTIEGDNDVTELPVITDVTSTGFCVNIKESFSLSTQDLVMHVVVIPE